MLVHSNKCKIPVLFVCLLSLWMIKQLVYLLDWIDCEKSVFFLCGSRGNKSRASSCVGEGNFGSLCLALLVQFKHGNCLFGEPHHLQALCNQSSKWPESNNTFSVLIKMNANKQTERMNGRTNESFQSHSVRGRCGASSMIQPRRCSNTNHGFSPYSWSSSGSW